MNKMLKLPLFLGACGLACAGLLAGVNAATKQEISDYKKEKIASEYVKIFNRNGYSVTDKQLKTESAVTLTDELYDAGGTGRALAIDIKGAAYTCKVKGYAGDVEFQVAFADGKYLGYTNISNKETSGYGADLIAKITSLIKGISAEESILTNKNYIDAMTNSSTTGKPVQEAIEACRNDYISIDWEELLEKEEEKANGGN